MSCHKLKGDFQKPITLTTNDPQNRQVTLNCTGKILEAVSLTPSVVNFGSVSSSEAEVERTVDIKRGDAGPIHVKIKPGPVAPDGYEASIEEVTAGEHYRLHVNLKTPLEKPRVRGTILLETGSEKTPDATVRVYGTRAPALQLQPRMVRVPAQIPPNWEYPVRVNWDTKGNYKVLAAAPSNSDMEVRLEDRDGAQYIVVKLPAGFKPRSRSERINLTTSHPAERSSALHVMFAGMVQRPPVRTRPVPATRTAPGAATGTNPGVPARLPAGTQRGQAGQSPASGQSAVKKSE